MATVLAILSLIVVGMTVSAQQASATPGWTSQLLGDPASNDSSIALHAVSCPTSTFCVAVGDYDTGGAQVQGKPFAATWNGTSWAETALPVLPNSLFSTLTGVSCTSTTSCVAVGAQTTQPDSNNQEFINAYAEVLSGTTWTLNGPFARPNGNWYASLQSISCTSATSCVAVGYTALSNYQGLVETYSGAGSWSATTVSAPGNPQFQSMTGISCPTAGACRAVGSGTVNGVSTPFVATLASNSWSVASLPIPTLPNVTGATPSAIDCVGDTAAADCLLTANTSAQDGYVEHPDGSGLTVLEPANNGSELDAISCPAVGSCVASGFEYDANNTQRAMVQTLSGGSWSAVTGFEPAGHDSPRLDGVSCPVAVTSCAAAGSVDGENLPMVATLVNSAPVKQSQTISFTSTPPANATVGGTYTVSATGGGSGNPVTFSTNSACSISGSTVSFVHAASCVINANQAGNSNYDAAAEQQQTIEVNQAGQSISFTSTVPSNAAVGGTYTVSATGGSSGNPVTFSVDSSTTNSSCTISGSTVSLVHAGSCVIDANQAGNADYSAAPQQQQTIGVGKAGQSISFTSTVPSNATVGGSDYQVSATGGASGNPVTFSVDSSTTNSSCTISGSTVSFAHAGSCVIDANQAGNADYTAAPQQQQTIGVGKAGQSISFTSTAPTNAAVTDTYTVTATGGASNNPVTFSIDFATTNSACSISGSTVSFVHAGSCVIDANQAGNADYSAAPQQQQTITVGQAGQSISFTSTPPTNATVGGTYTVTATGGGSGNPVTVSVDASTTNGACTISGSTVSFVHAGSCVIAANQAGNADYSAAPPSGQGIAVGAAAQAINFTSTPPATPSVGGSYTVTATGGASGNPVTFSVDPSTTNSACSISGPVVSFDHAGSCVVDADQAGNADYTAAPQQQQTLTVGKAGQTVSFTSTAPTSAAVGGSYTVTATGGASGNAVTFSVDPSTTNSACSVSGSTVSFDHAGSCVIDADQAGNADYTAAATQQQTFTIGKAGQSISFTSTAPTAAKVGGSYTVTATGGASGKPVTFSVDPSTTNSACSVSGSTVNFDHAGSCVIDADQAGNADYTAAATQQQSFTVGRAGQSISFVSTAPTNAVVGGTYAVTATGGASGNAVTFSVDSSTTNNACSISGSTVHFDHVGSCVIDADQAGNADYTAAPQQQQTVTVGQAAQSIRFTSTPPPMSAVGGSYTVTASGGASGNPVTFSIDSSTTNSACSISGAKVSFDHAGSCVIDADQAGNADYTAAPQVQQTVDVGQAAQTISYTSVPPATPAVGGSYTVTASGGASGNPVTFSVDPSTTNSACSVSGSTVSFDHSGSCVVDADQAGNADYTAAPQAQQTIVIGQATQTVTFTSTPPTSPTLGDQYSAAATGGASGNPVTFSVDATTTNSACSISGATVSFDHVGTCVIDANQAGDADYTAAPTVEQMVVVVPAATTTTLAITRTSVSATVQAVSKTAPTPTGTVVFSVGGKSIGSAALVNGVATLQRSVPPGMTEHVTAAYGGTADFLASSASTDRHDPQIRAVVSSAARKTRFGWYDRPVTIRFFCTTHGAAIIGGCPRAVTLTRSAAGQRVSRTIVATDGGSATVSVSGINIDRIAPWVRVGGVRNGATYHAAVPPIRCIAGDWLSGIASCRVTTQVHGFRTNYQVTATDRAGNTRTVRGSYFVSPILLRGVPYWNGSYVVHRGHDYDLIVTTPRQPYYYWATPYEGPGTRPTLFGGPLHSLGHGRWVITIHVTQRMRHYRYWVIGVKEGNRLVVIRLDVRA